MAGVIERVLKKFGYIRPPERNGAGRNYASAQMSRLTSSWGTRPTSMNQDLYRDRRILVARSRILKRDNEYAKQFVAMVKANVVGPNGLSLQVQALRDDGTLDEFDSTALENAFADFSKIGNFEVTGKLSRCDFEQLWVETLATDGETLVRRIQKRGAYNYQLQMLDPLLIDDSYNVDLAGDVKIRMGVEINGWGQVLAIHMLPNNANDIHGSGVASWGGAPRVRIPAAEIWHDFICEQTGQLRGAPWMATPALTMNMLGGYEEAALVAARTGAANVGFFKQNEYAPDKPSEAMADGKDGNDDFVVDAEPGTFRTLPLGLELQNFNPDYPHAMFGSFVKQCLRRVSAGLPGSTYTALSGDMESVNYSSARIDLLRERETWKRLQNFMIERLAARVYSEWLPFALLSGKALSAKGQPLPFSKLKKFDAALWQGVRWPWVDPQKEVGAQIEAINNGLTSRGRVIREQGGDPEEIWRELEKENARLKNILPPPPPAKPGSGIPPGEPNA